MTHILNSTMIKHITACVPQCCYVSSVRAPRVLNVVRCGTAHAATATVSIHVGPYAA